MQKKGLKETVFVNVFCQFYSSNQRRAPLPPQQSPLGKSQNRGVYLKENSDTTAPFCFCNFETFPTSNYKLLCRETKDILATAQNILTMG